MLAASFLQQPIWQQLLINDRLVRLTVFGQASITQSLLCVCEETSFVAILKKLSAIWNIWIMNCKRTLLITKLPSKLPFVFKTCRLYYILATRVMSKRNLGINPVEGHKQNREKVWVTDRIRIWCSKKQQPRRHEISKETQTHQNSHL